MIIRSLCLKQHEIIKLQLHKNHIQKETDYLWDLASLQLHNN